jgi:ribosomal protein L16 Arg81 hydroxylase
MMNIFSDASEYSSSIEETIIPLIGGQTITRFNSDVRERCWAHYQGAFKQPNIKELFYSVDRFETDVASSAIRTEKIDVFVNGQLVRLVDLHHKSGRSPLAVLIDQLRGGAMVRVRDLENAVPALEQTVRMIERLFLAQCQANLYLAPAGGAGFPAHFDISDAFVVQCAGMKEWCIYEDYTERNPLPTSDTPWEPTRYQPIGMEISVAQQEGDVLYLPRGVMHAARCTDQYSLHLTISLENLTYADVLQSEIRRIAHDIPDLRSRIPWSWDSKDELLTGALRDKMRMLADRVEAGPSLEEARRALVRSRDIAPGMLSHILTQSG